MCVPLNRFVQYPRQDSNSPSEPQENRGHPTHAAQKTAHLAPEHAPTEEDVLMAAWEALSKDGQGEFLSRLPPEFRAILLAHAGRSTPPAPPPRPGQEVHDA
jgi:hypothetical protein